MYPNLECTTVTLWWILLGYYFWDAFPDAEQPPTYANGHNSSRLNVVLQYLRHENAWDFSTAAHVEFKSTNAGPEKLRECEAQLQNGAATLLNVEGPGQIYSLSIAGCLCRAFMYTKLPGGSVTQIPLTGEGGSSLDTNLDYMDIYDMDEGRLINSILRDIREAIG